jgi:hypothetical protein
VWCEGVWCVSLPLSHLLLPSSPCLLCIESALLINQFISSLDSTASKQTLRGHLQSAFSTDSYLSTLVHPHQRSLQVIAIPMTSQSPFCHYSSGAISASQHGYDPSTQIEMGLNMVPCYLSYTQLNLHITPTDMHVAVPILRPTKP